MEIFFTELSGNKDIALDTEWQLSDETEIKSLQICTKNDKNKIKVFVVEIKHINKNHLS